MKATYLLSLFFFLFNFCQAQEGIHFENLTHDEALLKAEKNNKQVFIDCYTKTCGPCKYMARMIFPQKECGDFFNPKFVSIMKDMEEGDGVDIAKKYNVRVFPTFLILNSDGSVHMRIDGGGERETDAFLKKMKEYLWLADAKKKYESRLYNDEFLQQYMDILKCYDALQLQKVIAETMLNKGIEQLSEPKSWKRLKSGITNPEDTVFRYVMENRELFIQYLQKPEVEDCLMSIFNEDFRQRKMMIQNFDQRLADLQLLENEGYIGAKSLRYKELLFSTIKGKNSCRTDELLTLLCSIEREIPDEAERASVLKEIQGLESIIKTPEQKIAFKNQLSKLIPSLLPEHTTPIKRVLMNLSKD